MYLHTFHLGGMSSPIAGKSAWKRYIKTNFLFFFLAAVQNNINIISGFPMGKSTVKPDAEEKFPPQSFSFPQAAWEK